VTDNTRTKESQYRLYSDYLLVNIVSVILSIIKWTNTFQRKKLLKYFFAKFDYTCLSMLAHICHKIFVYRPGQLPTRVVIK